ncbi:MFS transporter [Bradyrhizobium guangdongense]|nr:MFS transporter [Bradyrhizobium guangdongense]
MTSVNTPALPAVGDLSPQVQLRGIEATKVVLGSGIGMLTNFGPIVIYTFGTFLLPIVNDTGWSRASVAAALAPAALCSGFSQPIVGWLVDRYGPRVFAGFSFALFALGLIALGQLPRDPLSFAIFMGLLGLLGAGQGITAFTYIVTRTFSTFRGFALGIINAASAAGIMLMPAIATFSIAEYGWRNSYAAIGAGVAILGAVAVIWLIPGKERFQKSAASAQSSKLVFGELLSAPIFWMLALAFLLMTLAIQGMIVHMTPLLIDRGFRPVDAAAVMATYGMTMLVARFLLGSMLDRWSPRLVAVVGCLGPVAAGLLLVSTRQTSMVYLAAALLALGAGAESDLIPYTVARQFGVAQLGQKIGLFIVVFAIGVAIGPLMFSAVQALRGNYDIALIASSALMLAASVIFALIPSASLSQNGEKSG